MPGSTDIVDRLIGLTGDLYSLPAVAVEVLELTSDPKADARQLKECIEKDPALTTKILRVVNSSLFGLSQQVCDLNQALALLGMKPLKLLVLGFSLPDALFSQIGGDVLSRYWQRTLIKAIAAREICGRASEGLGDEAFIAGLLQDIGLLVLVQYVGQPYVRFLSKVQADQGSLNQLERLAIGFDHTQISARLLERWHLPSAIVEAIAAAHDGHDQLRRSPKPLVRVLELAELVASLLCDGRAALLPQIVDQAPREQGSWLDDLIATLEHKVQQLADSLSLELPQGLNYREVLDRSRRQMAAVAQDLVGDLVHDRAASTGSPADSADSAVEQRLLQETRSLENAFASVCREPGRTPANQRVAHAPHAPASPVAMADVPPDDSGSSLGDDALLLGRLRQQVAICRQRRVPLSLMLIAIDRYDEVVFHEGPQAAQRLFGRLWSECQAIDHEEAICLQTTDSRFAVMLPNCDRREVARIGQALIAAVRKFKTSKHAQGRPAMTISIGASTVALPPRNFPAEDLLVSANRCLSAGRSGGGDLFKSIEIY